MTASFAETICPFFLIRHGETDWNRDGRLQGQHDIPLNPLGRDQAASAGRTLRKLLRRRDANARDLRFVASPLGRARDTMERVRRELGLELEGYECDDRLKELSFGSWEGLTWADVKAAAPAALKERKRDKWNFVPPGGESYAMLAERVRPWLETVKPLEVVVAHGGVARVLMHLIAGAPPATAPEIDVWQGRVMLFEHGSCHWD
jgi:broad specificity phosphatase PhoE